jgi:hypothetical protein
MYGSHNSSKGSSKKVSGKSHGIEMHEGHKHHSGSRMSRSFTRVEHDPLHSHHKGKPSGCME